MSLLRRLRGLVSRPPADAPPAADPDAAAPRRRRGRRGGRGRRRGSGEAAAAPPARTNGGAATPLAERTRTPRTRDDRRRSAGPRGRPPRRRGSLEAPLPEDVAFRPATEGGDGSILPDRRRRPPGARTTSRVLVTGKRNLPVFPEGDGEPEPADRRRDPPEFTEPSARGGEPAADGDAPEAGQRRRRGRRGGRGRRGRGPAANGGAGAPPDAAPAGGAFARRDGEREPESGGEAAAGRDGTGHGDADPEPPEAFAALGVSGRSLTAIARMGFREPTPVQERAIPILLAGRDVVGIAQTGTGKTLAFGVPMAEALDPASGNVEGLVLVPTRELAQQVLAVLADLARPFGMRAIGLLGGHALEGDFRALDEDPRIVVGTPGRIKDHLRRGTLSLRRVRLAVLDEADQMLDIGFLPDITHILGRTPRSRQTALFSATMPQTVMRLVRRYMDDPERVAVASDLDSVESIEHIYFEVAQRDKVRGLRELIDRELRGRTLVFSRTRRGVDRLAGELQGLGVRVGALHGDLDQRRRDGMVRRFRGGELDILVATNVAARGIDIPEITHVVNYDVPDNAEEYIHRTGRTGRAGREGKAITFASETDLDRFDVLHETFGDRLRKERLDLYALPRR